MTRSVKIVYGRILMARLPLTSTISAELNLGIRIKKYSFFCLLTIFCWIWIPPNEQQGTSGSPCKDCQHCADLWSQKCKCLQLPLCSQYSDFPGYFVVDITIFLWSQIIHFCIFWNYVAKMASNNTSLPEIKFSCVYRLQKSLQNKCWCE